MVAAARGLILLWWATAEAFIGSKSCYFERDGVKYWSAVQLENAILGDESKWPFRLARTPAYDMSMRPAVWESGDPGTAGVETVRYDFQMTHFFLDEKANALTLHGYETYSWRDARLNHTVAPGCYRDDHHPPEWIMTPLVIAKLWHPDVFVVNAMDERRAFRETDSVYVGTDGRITVTYQSSRTVACQLRLYNFPMDVQRCHMWVGSYGYVSRQVLIEAGPIAPSMEQASVFNNQWKIENAWVDAVLANFETLEYSEAHLGIKFRRKHRYYVSEAIFPALFFLAIAWAGFWVDRNSPPARVAIAVIPVLIMRTLLNGVYANLQIISYSIFLTSILHLGESLAVICVFEYALVSCVLQRERRRLEEHRLYIALRVPILHYVQMSEADARSDDENRPGPRASVVAAVDRLRDRFERYASVEDGRVYGSGLASLLRAHCGRHASPSHIEFMMDFMSPGSKSLSFAKVVEFLVDYDRLFPASIGCVRRLFADMPLSEQIDVVFRFGFPALATLSLSTVVAAREWRSRTGGDETPALSPMTTQWIPFGFLALLGGACAALDALMNGTARQPPPDARVSSDSNRWAAVVASSAAGTDT